MYSIEEKILLFGALFFDVGKFRNICFNEKISQVDLNLHFLKTNSDIFIKVLGNNEESFKRLCNIIENNFDQNTDDELITCINIAAKSSTKENTETTNEQEYANHFLKSIFSRINLLSKQETSSRYYRHEVLTKKNYNVLVPEETNQENLISQFHYNNQTDIYNLFTNDIRSVFKFYEDQDEFETLINLLLLVFEKYMWCLPSFIVGSASDISLFNHSKDLAAVSHALYKTRKSDKECTEVNLVVGEMPGIQKYIFDITEKKPAKILRGRSIYVQLLTRHFASIFLKSFGLTEVSLIMLAGGKFYILAPQNKSFQKNYEEAIEKIEKYLADNFFYEIQFASAYTPFDVSELNDGKINFGDIIDKASYELLKGRNQIFKMDLFGLPFNESKFILKSQYIDSSTEDSNSIKCKVTNRPVRKGRERKIDDALLVDLQIFNEYKIGKEIPYGAVVIEFNNELNKIQKDISSLQKSKPDYNNYKIIINPSLDELLSYPDSKKNLLRNSLIIEAANFCSYDANEFVKDFEEIVKLNNGAEFLTLVKGDIDNLGLLMSCGLSGDEKGINALSRITTLSYHLKYFFSFFINGFLKDWDQSMKNLPQDDPNSDQNVYSIFAGGDDLMFITTQSASLKLVNDFNHKFKDFVCNNDEVHISYSLTNFKEHTPIRLVADISEHNQETIKSTLKGLYGFDSLYTYINSLEPFSEKNDKSGMYLFNSVLKNSFFSELLKWKNLLIKWIDLPNTEIPFTKGTLNNLLQLSSLLKNYYEKGEIEKLIYFPLINYQINRNIKRNGSYFSSVDKKEFEYFFDSAKSINLNEGVDIKKILYPLTCSVIYALRKK